MMPRTKQIRKKSSMNKRHNPSGPSSSNVTLTDSANLHLDIEEPADVLMPSHALVAKEYESSQDFLNKFNIYYDDQIKRHNLSYKLACEEVKTMFCSIIQQLPDAMKHANVHEYLHMGYLEEQQKELNSEDDSNVSHLSSRKPMDTTVLQPLKTPRKINTRVSPRRRSLCVAQAPPPQTEVFKTPLISARRLQPGTTITPKIYSETPITVMRRPLHGELAISLSGSPLMVGATSCEDIPTVNVPLRDGRILSIMPEAGAPPLDLPFLDETTRKYLQTLRGHLQILAPNSPAPKH
uniref:Borealin C-terminal domain-containing protein n=1 Tax=Graphocephala atropunctata TaxID=36148 RepID=A0A1B6MHT3_9HEMI